MLYQIIEKNIMLKKIKRGNSNSFIRINLYNTTKYIFSTKLSDLPKLLKTLKIKIKNKKSIKKKQ